MLFGAIVASSEAIETRVKSPSATECYIIGETGYVFFYDPAKWTPKPDGKVTNHVKFISVEEKVEAIVGRFTAMNKSRKPPAIEDLNSWKAVHQWISKEEKTAIPNVKIISQDQYIINGSHFSIFKIEVKPKDGPPEIHINCAHQDKGGTLSADITVKIESSTKSSALFEEFINGLITERLSDCTNVKSRKAWLDKYKPSLTDEYRVLISEHKVRIGMTEDHAVLSWGYPESKNNTITKSGRQSQWVYPPTHSFLYFDDGELVAIQN